MNQNVPASQKILFISDVHLGGFTEEKNIRLEQELIQLIDYAQQHSMRITILGDLFDFWIEYPSFVPALGQKVLQRFQQFNRKSENSLYITGNHDNWTLGHFANQGFDVEPEYRILHINNKKILLLHGDATGNDLQHLQRPLMHRIIRNRAFLKLYRSILPPKVGLWVMKKVSQITAGSKKKEDDPAPLDRWSTKMLGNTDIDYIICGHDHTPRRTNFDFGTYLNLGTFHYHKTMVLHNNGTFRIVNWNSKRNKLTPFYPQQKTHE